MIPRKSKLCPKEEPLPSDAITAPRIPAQGTPGPSWGSISSIRDEDADELIDVESIEDDESPETRRKRFPERKIRWGFKHPLERMRLEKLEGKPSTDSCENEPPMPLSRWELVLKKMVDDPATHSLPQIFLNEDRRALALGSVRISRMAGSIAVPADLRVATCREVCRLHVTDIADGKDEPDWKSLWLSASTKNTPVQYDELSSLRRSIRPFECFPSLDTPSTPSSSPEIESLTNDIECGLSIDVKETINDDLDLENMILIESSSREPEKIKENTTEPLEEITQKEESVQPVVVPCTTAYSNRRQPTRTAILIPVSDAPAPPTRGRGRKRAQTVFPTGKQPIPQDPPAARPKRKYTRKSALSELPAAVADTAPPPPVESPILQSSTRGRKRKTVEPRPLPVPGISAPKTRRGRMMVAEETAPKIVSKRSCALKIDQSNSDLIAPASTSDKSKDLREAVVEKEPIGEVRDVKKDRRRSGKKGTAKGLKESVKTAQLAETRETDDLKTSKTFVDHPMLRKKLKSRRKKRLVSLPLSPEFFTPEEIPTCRKEEIDNSADIDNMSDDTYFYEEPCSTFSAPPEQYQFYAPRRVKCFVPTEDDPDIQILSPPPRRDVEYSDDIQIIESVRTNEEDEVKQESDEESDIAVQITITDAEYDEDGDDDPPLGAELIEACDYLQLDADNEICEDFVPFPPEKARVDAGVFSHFVTALSLKIYNIRLPRISYRYIHFPIDFINFFYDVKLVEIHDEVEDALAVVNEALCNMSVQATHLLTHHTDKNTKQLVTSNKFKELVKMFLSDRNDLRDEMAREAFGTTEGPEYENLKSIWDPMMKTILLRMCDSLLSLARETNSWEAPCTDNVLRRRFEVILIGWRNFILRGGILKTIFNLQDIPEKVRKVFCNWFQCQDAVLEDIKIDLEVGAESRTQALINEMESSGNAMRWNECRENVSRNESDLHKHKCNICKLFFTQEDLLKAHKQVHDYTPHLCEICFLGFAYKVSLRIHGLQRHFKEMLTGELRL